MMSPEEGKLSDLITAVQQISPQLADCWQATAIIESLGYTDGIIQSEFGFPDALALGRYIYGCQEPASPEIDRVVSCPEKSSLKSGWWPLLRRESYLFLTEFSRSFVYAIPLILALWLNHLPSPQDRHWFPAELSEMLTLTTILSLITSGGFVQMISRRGVFYQQLGEKARVKTVCLSILALGMTVSLILSLLSTWFGFYRSVVPDPYLLLANAYYLLLSALWMGFAILSILIPWGTPLALLGLTLLFVGFRVLLHLGAIESQVLTMGITLGILAGVVGVLFKGDTPPSRAVIGQDVPMPRLSAVVYLMAPYFSYGVLYFLFVFGDRIVAGLAINPASGHFYGIDSAYQSSMDLALLTFLLLVPFVEYLSFVFIRYWYSQSKSITVDYLVFFSRRLLYRHQIGIITIALVFSVSLTLIITVFKPVSWPTTNLLIIVLGSLGYLLLSIGLFNALILFSLDQAGTVSKALFPALLVNLGIGYLSSLGISPFWAVLGLLVGSALFIASSSRPVMQAMQQPDRMYYLGGY